MQLVLHHNAALFWMVFELYKWFVVNTHVSRFKCKKNKKHQSKRRKVPYSTNVLYSPQVLAVEISCTGAIFCGSIILGVPRQQRHQVVGGTKAAFTLYGLGRTDREQQDYMHIRTHRLTVCDDAKKH